MIFEINAHYNTYVAFNATNIPTLYITRCHIWGRSRCTCDLSSVEAILHFLLLLCLSFCLASQTRSVKHCGWYNNVIFLKLLQLKFLRLSVSDVLSQKCFAEEQIMCCMSQVFFRKQWNNKQMKN